MVKVTSVLPVVGVDDLDKSVEFYVDALGLTETFRFGEPPFYAGVQVAEGLDIHLNTKADHAGKGEIYLTVDDADAMLAQLKSKGVAIEIELADQPYGMRDFSVRDPAGNFITLGTPLPES